MRQHDYDDDYSPATAKVAGYITIGAILALVAIRIAFERN